VNSLRLTYGDRWEEIYEGLVEIEAL